MTRNILVGAALAIVSASAAGDDFHRQIEIYTERTEQAAAEAAYLTAQAELEAARKALDQVRGDGFPRLVGINGRTPTLIAEFVSRNGVTWLAGINDSPAPGWQILAVEGDRVLLRRAGETTRYEVALGAAQPVRVR